jgi:acetyl-CoA carboxylase carboxyltransferase component
MSAAIEEILQLPPRVPSPPAHMRERAAELRHLHGRVRSGPDGRATEAQKARGKLTVHERLDLLFKHHT